MEERGDAYGVLVGKPEGTRPLEKSRCRCEDNIKMIFRKWDGEKWTGLIWLRIGPGAGHL
jgi:hypothetical protein